MTAPLNWTLYFSLERSALDIQEGDEETRAGSGNGTDTDDEDAVTENGMDESDDGLSADDFDEAVLVNDSNETVNVMEANIGN